eukprot:gene6601-12140_t
MWSQIVPRYGAMQKASDKLLGEHDFRNFCKVDVGNNVNHFVRKIESINISACDENGARVTTDKEDQMFEITICGMAFLWHQVRCMVSVLFLIGLRLESSEVIDRLLDVEFCPKKPQYSMASEVPLVLYDCTFDKINWIFETALIKNEGPRAQELCELRRRLWFAAINKEDASWKKVDGWRVCSTHFKSGKPASLFDENNPNWVPTKNLGYERFGATAETDLVQSRYDRAKRMTTGQEKPVLDKIVTAAYALTNLCQSVVPFD